ncbi:hypothetical protein TNCV_215911 [Trichonephila clavipes]|nr:hypothetical protein TNCV_215911 [Trichonephila clavipes]
MASPETDLARSPSKFRIGREKNERCGKPVSLKSAFGLKSRPLEDGEHKVCDESKFVALCADRGIISIHADCGLSGLGISFITPFHFKLAALERPLLKHLLEIRFASCLFNNMTSETVEVARIALRLPPFWKSNVRLWIAQCDHAFTFSGISSDDTKYSALVANLDAETPPTCRTLC